MSDRKQFRSLSPPEELQAAVDDLDVAAGTETVPLLEADGRVLAERIDAGIDVPGFDRSTMDGYAVRAEDTFDASEGDPFVAPVVAEIPAGGVAETEVAAGEAAEISTGAPLPPGADAVVPVERTSPVEGDRVSIRAAVAPGDNVMASGADVAAGERALGPGTVVTTRDVGLLAALGVDSVPAVEAPTVGIVSTGDELVRPGEDAALDRGQIYDLNTYAVAAAVRDAGGDPEIVPHVGDDYDRMKETMDEVAARCDVVLSSGSTSASDEDVLYQVVEDHGELHLHGVAVKPGRPTIVGRFGGTPYVGLPGNPVSALSVFRAFVASKIRAAAGRPEPPTATLAGTMAAPLRYSEGRTYLLPVAVVEDGDGDVLVYPVDKGSGAITSLTEADGVVEMAPETERLSVGQSVTVKLFDAADRPPSVLGIGESDPLIARVLDRLDGPRYLGHGTREGRRRLRDGVSDFAVLAGDVDADGEELARFSREWGLVVPPGNPDGVEGLADLPDLPGRFVNLAQSSGLRASLDDRLDAVADRSRADLAEAIEGYGRSVNGYMTPAKRVARGDAAAGLGLRFTAASLDVDFVPVGEQPVRVVAAADRLPKPGMERLTEVLEEAVPELLADLPGYGPAE